MYVFGGRTEEGSDLGDLAAFRITSRRWYTFQNMGPSPSPRSGHSMTAHGKQVIVLGGEPSTATREATDLAIAYYLDTSKIRYPNDQQIQQTPSGERVPGSRRPSAGDKNSMGANRGPQGPLEPKRSGRESMISPQNMYRQPIGQPGINGNDMNGVAPGSAQAQGPQTGSKLPRASINQPPPGPPPQQQLPPPKINSNAQQGGPPKAKPAKSFGPAVDTSIRSTSRSGSKERSPAPRDSPSESPIVNGRRTPTAQAPKPRLESGDGSSNGGSARSPSKSRQNRSQNSLDSINESIMRSVTNGQVVSPPVSRQVSNAMRPNGSNPGSTNDEKLLLELETARNRNAWYASELELARKAGYMPSPSNSPMLDQKAADSFGEEDRPLIEALLAMKTELSNVQSSIDRQAVIAAKQIAEMEKQRDAAVNEAVYAKAKLAAHGGSQNGTPQPESLSRDLGDMSLDRSSDIGRKLASALALQKELKNKGDMIAAELEAEQRSRQLAEETANNAQQRITELEAYKQQNSSEVESLKAELHEVQKNARGESRRCAEAVAALELLQVDAKEIKAKYEETLGSSKDHSDTFSSLREAIAASADMKDTLERKLDEERTMRQGAEEKLRKLMAEHEERTAELETVTRRLHDAEELAENHANEAKTHRQAVLAGLDKIATRDMSATETANSERVSALKAQVEASTALVQTYQAAADAASEKLRGAEERIAGLEAYQEQASREGLSIRKQLQVAMREAQTLQAANSEMKHALANQQLETNAVYVQHNTLKDILGERGISPSGAARIRGLPSPSGSNTPDPSRLRDLEQQLSVALQANQEAKQTFESQQQEAESTYREKLSQLENDYQSAVHYVKGTEKMLKRMKEELSKYKTENTRLKTELEELGSSQARNVEAPAEWEAERTSLVQKVQQLQDEMKSSASKLEQQLKVTQDELARANADRDHYVQTHEEAHRELSDSFEQARSDLTQLQEENSLLERRALDAEQKVTLLLDQVETSVGSYRRQSRIPDVNGIPNVGAGHSRQTSMAESIGESVYTVTGEEGNRNSLALDNLASELETLRSHWETTNKSYRLSNAFEFDKSGETASKPDLDLAVDHDVGEDAVETSALSEGLADWRKRLEAEEREKGERKGSADSDVMGTMPSHS
jgi:hypothetical protein